MFIIWECDRKVNMEVDFTQLPQLGSLFSFRTLHIRPGNVRGYQEHQSSEHSFVPAEKNQWWSLGLFDLGA